MRSFPHGHRNAPDARVTVVPNNKPQDWFTAGSMEMNNLRTQGLGTRHPAAIRAAEAAAPSNPYMEHRWGQRRRCRARVCISAGAGITGTARVRDVSTSGAFLETALPLPLFSQIVVAVLSDDGAGHALEFSAAVVRHEPDGVGIEWCEPVAGSICRSLGCTLNCAAASPGRSPAAG